MEGDDEQNKIPEKRPAPQAQSPEFLFFSNTRGNSRAKNSNELRMVLFSYPGLPGPFQNIHRGPHRKKPGLGRETMGRQQSPPRHSDTIMLRDMQRANRNRPEEPASLLSRLEGCAARKGRRVLAGGAAEPVAAAHSVQGVHLAVCFL